MEWGPEGNHLERGRATLADALAAPRLTGYLLLDIGPLLWSVWISRLLGLGGGWWRSGSGKVGL